MRTVASFALPFSALHRRASTDPSPARSPVRSDPSVRGRRAAGGRPVLRAGPREPWVRPPDSSVDPPESSIGGPE